MTLLTKSLAALTLAAAFTPLARADFDFTPKIVNNQVATAGHDDENGLDVPTLLVGNFAFGEIPSDPYNIGDPGFNTGGASPFTPSSALRFHGLPIDGAFLRYWDGTGSPNFTPAPANISLALAGSPTRSISLTADAVTYVPTSPDSLLIGSFTSNGALHIHLTSSLFADGAQLDGSVPTGAYLISFTLQNPGTGLADSTPLFILFNNGLDDPTNDTALAYVNATYASIPEPTSTFFLLTTLPLLRRPRR